MAAAKRQYAPAASLKLPNAAPKFVTRVEYDKLVARVTELEAFVKLLQEPEEPKTGVRRKKS